MFKRMIYFICLLSAIIALPLLALDETNFVFKSTYDEARYHNLTKEVRCLVCQNQSIADSNAPLANDLRVKIYHLVNQQQTDDDIKSYLVKRYGEFILLNPRFTTTTSILWLFPLMGFGIAISLFIYFFRRQHAKRDG